MYRPTGLGNAPAALKAGVSSVKTGGGNWLNTLTQGIVSIGTIYATTQAARAGVYFQPQNPLNSNSPVAPQAISAPPQQSVAPITPDPVTQFPSQLSVNGLPPWAIPAGVGAIAFALLLNMRK